MSKKKYFHLSVTLVIAVLFWSSQGCKKNDDSGSEAIQKKIDAVTDSVRIATEAVIGKTIPTLNIFIETPDGSWFSSSAGSGYEKITADTYFRFASNTKTFTSTCILNMQEDGWLDINDKITDDIPGSDISYVPASEAWNIPHKDQITLRMLLQHSAGVYDVDNDSVPGCNGNSFTVWMEDNDPEHQFTPEEMVEQAAIHQLSYFEPGAGHHYSNTGYAILAEIIGRVYSFHAGTPKVYADYLHDKITGPGSPVPITVKFPYLATDKELPEPSSCGHYLIDSEYVIPICSYNISAQIGEGNGISTLRHMNTFIRTLMKGENVLTPSSVALMKTDVSPGNENYGLGCIYTSGLGYGHNGARIGNASVMAYDPDTDVSITVYISAWDIPQVMVTIMSMYDLAGAVRSTLGY